MAELDQETQEKVTQEIGLKEMVQQLLDVADKCLATAATLAVISGEKPAPGSILEKLLGVIQTDELPNPWATHIAMTTGMMPRTHVSLSSGGLFGQINTLSSGGQYGSNSYSSPGGSNGR